MRADGRVVLVQNFDVTVDHTGFHRLHQVAAEGFEDVGCDDFLHCLVSLGFSQTFFRVGDGDEFGAASSVYEY